MGNGFEQFLANRITNLGLLQVVADPRKADAVFTDHLGISFESRMDELFPPARPEKPKPAPPKAAKESGATEAEAKDTEQPPIPYASSFGRGKGTLFLVDARTRNIVWSTYDKPRDFTSPELDRAAVQVAERLKRALKSK